MEKHLGAQINYGQSTGKFKPGMELLKPKSVCSRPKQPALAEKQLIRKLSVRPSDLSGPVTATSVFSEISWYILIGS